MLVYVVLLLLGVTGVGAQAPLQTCGGSWQTARLAADRESGCRRFWQCQVDGSWVSLECPSTLLFHEERQVCEWPSLVTCRDASGVTMTPNPGVTMTPNPGSTPMPTADPCLYPCPKGAVHPYPDLQHPGRGWFCINGVLSAFDCATITLGLAPFYDAITHACVGQLACTSSPCRNGGRCAPHGNSFYCSCPPPFSGPTCTETSSQPTTATTTATTTRPTGLQCQYPCPATNLFLYPDLTDTGRFFQCLNGQLQGFSCLEVVGPNKTFYDPTAFDCVSRTACQPNPCGNNGVCSPSSSGFSCSCPAPFTGPTCTETFTSATTTATTTRPTGLQCQYPCPAGNLFLYPDLTDTGRFFQCLNGQLQGFSCLEVVGPNKTFYDPTAFDCVRTPATSTTSTTSTAPVSSACRPSPCQNDGQCLDIGGRPYCLCPNNFGGATCTEGATPPSTPPSTASPRCQYPCPLGAAYLYPHLQDRGRFVQCYNGVLTDFSCSQVTNGAASFWDQETFYCLQAPRLAF